MRTSKGIFLRGTSPEPDLQKINRSVDVIRIGFGYDVHRLVEGRKLIIGGIDIPHTLGLEGHSDADVLVHAIADALLGSVALGDIGSHFPDTDERWRGADSLELLAEVRRKIELAGYVVVNVDASVALQRPKLRPYIDQMRQKIARALEVDSSQVSVKATTAERLGFVGSEEGVEAYAVCLVSSKN